MLIHRDQINIHYDNLLLHHLLTGIVPANIVRTTGQYIPKVGRTQKAKTVDSMAVPSYLCNPESFQEQRIVVSLA